MSRAPTRAWALVLAVLLLPVATARPLVNADVTVHVGLPKQALSSLDAPLRVTMALGVPAVRGSAEYVSIVRVLPAGEAPWSGVWWASSEAGASTPHRLTVDAGGALVDHSTGSVPIQGGVLHIRYHFVSPSGVEWDYDAPPLNVLDATPSGDAPVLAGAAADDSVLAFEPWNLMSHAARMGYTLRDAEGGIVREERVASCADLTVNETESGCRLPYVVPRQGASLQLWHEADGARQVDAELSIAALARHPYVFAA